MTAPQATNAFSRYASVLRPGLFAGETHWVTGGGSGIGRCVAHELASLGATVVLTGRAAEKLKKVAAEIAEDGGRADIAAFDIRDEEAVRGAVKDVVARHGRIHGLVNNAGGQFPAPLMAIGKKGFETVLANNLTGGFLMMREVFLQSMQAHGGAVVNMTADMWNGMPGMGHSGAARAGMANLTKTAAVEWAAAGVRVNAVAPGYTATELTLAGRSKPEWFETWMRMTPMGRLGEPKEIANAVLFLASDAASYITGTVLMVDGGYTAM